MFRRVGDWLALTSTERKIILFLSGTVLAGAGIKLYQEAFPSVPHYDYAASDSAFAVLSARESAQAEADSSLVVEPNAEESPAEDDTAIVKIDINAASKQDLMSLPGIGDVMSDRIIAYRTDVGPFRSIDELKKVKGISKRKLEQLVPFITIE
jgi:competence protein ComEA